MADKFFGTVIEVSIKEVFRVVKTVVGYKRELCILKREYGRLNAESGRINGLAECAKRNGEVLLAHVEYWQERSEEKKKEADVVIEQFDRLKKSCWLLIPRDYYALLKRYKYAKRAESLYRLIDGLVTDGNKIQRDTLSSLEPNDRPFPDRSAADYKATPSREEYIVDLKASLVGNGDGHNHSIVVYGQKGVGKTTLVNKLAVEIDSLREFKGIVMLRAELLQRNDALRYIQDLIAERVGFHISDYKTIEGRAMKINERLSHKDSKVLIVIDDAEIFIPQLGGIGIPFPSASCRIVYVAKSLTGCPMMADKCKPKTLEVEPLTQNEALQLFHELRREYEFANTPKRLKTDTDHICSKRTWLPGEIRDYAANPIPTDQGYSHMSAVRNLIGWPIDQVPTIPGLRKGLSVLGLKS